jgi:hypothetical protein
LHAVNIPILKFVSFLVTALNMITIFTPSTISTTFSSSMIVITVVFLLVLLVQKELTSTLRGKKAAKLHEILNIGIFPLLFVFILFVISRIAQEVGK